MNSTQKSDSLVVRADDVTDLRVVDCNDTFADDCAREQLEKMVPTDIDGVRNCRSEEFYKRLKSFTTTAYFAMPICLSPIVCATAGWEIPSEDPKKNPTSLPIGNSTTILSCSKCNAVLAIMLLRTLSAVGKDKLMLHYRTQLWKAHTISCPYHNEETCGLRPIFFGEDNPASNAVQNAIIPPAVALNLPSTSGSVALIEHPAPIGVFCQQWLKLYPFVYALNQPIVAPDFLLHYDQNENVLSTLLNRIVELLLKSPNADFESTVVLPDIETVRQIQAAEACVAIVLMGWDLQTDDNKETPSISCVFCLARHPLCSVSSASTRDLSATESKKRKTLVSTWNNPVTSHRFYCPLVCGFAQGPESSNTTSPIWQSIADRLLVSPLPPNSSEAVTNACRLLRSGVSSRRHNFSMHSGSTSRITK